MSQDTEFFFTGNCQIMYLAAAFSRIHPGRVHVLGVPYGGVPVEGPAPDFHDQPGFLAMAANARRSGKRTVLVVQSHTLRQPPGAVQQNRETFNAVVPCPGLHFLAPWANSYKDLISEASDEIERIDRFAAEERVRFSDTLRRCELPDSVGDGYWAILRTAGSFYHPGHPNGRVFAYVLRALEPRFAAAGVNVGDVSALLDGAMGVAHGIRHPLSKAAGQRLGLAWTDSDPYQAWRELAMAMRSFQYRLSAAEQVRPLLPEAERVLGPYLAAHLKFQTGKALALSRRAGAGLPYMIEATKTLAFHKFYMSQALSWAIKLKQSEAVRDILVSGAPVMHGNLPFRYWLVAAMNQLHASDWGRQTLDSVASELDGLWLNTFIQSGPQPLPERRRRQRQRAAAG